MKEILLEARDVCKTFDAKKAGTPVLNHVSVEICRGDFTVIMGPSGAGKSTLLYALSGVDGISSGEVAYRGRVISSLNEKQMADIRAREFGFVFQQTHLVSNLTLFENVAVAGYLGTELPEAEIRRRAVELLGRMNVGAARDRLPAEVSGGEAQRAAMARAMINRPGLIFADEPTGALNRRNTREVLDILTDLFREGQSILMVTHDVRAAVRGTRLLYLEDGNIMSELKLPPFDPAKDREREDRVNQWLASLRW